MPTLIGSAARADQTNGLAIWERPTTAPALTMVRRSTAPNLRRLVIGSSRKGFFRWAILPRQRGADKGYDLADMRSWHGVDGAGVGAESFARIWIEIKHVAAAIELQRGAAFKRRKVIEHVA